MQKVMTAAQLARFIKNRDKKIENMKKGLDKMTLVELLGLYIKKYNKNEHP